MTIEHDCMECGEPITHEGYCEGCDCALCHGYALGEECPSCGDEAAVDARQRRCAGQGSGVG